MSFTISLYKAYVLPHLEYCCSLLLGISKALKNNIESTNYYVIKTLLNLGNSATYDFCLEMAAMDTLAWAIPCNRLFYFFKCFKLDGPNCISQFFTPRLSKYNLRGSSSNVVQPSCNSLVAHMWSQLPAVTKSSTTLAQFGARLNNVNFTGCKCMNSRIQFYLFILFIYSRASL